MMRILLSHKNVAAVEVLKNINLKIDEGQSLAIIGENGAGKSTLLKIISGVAKASSGTLEVNCSIGALLELGSGFDPEYTGLENLKMSATLAGIKDDFDFKIQKMIEFADIGDYINQPVSTYSSGMVVRLGFAVITQTKPQLLITDEILAVGDENFQLKCLEWVKNYVTSGGTILLVSHSTYHVTQICKQAIWLEHGQIKMSGSSWDVANAYKSSINNKLEEIQCHKVDDTLLGIKDVTLMNLNGEAIKTIRMGETLRTRVILNSPDGKPPGLCMGIVGYDNRPIYGTYSDFTKAQPKHIGNNTYQFTVDIPNLPLLPGQYRIKTHTMTPDQLQLVDTWESEITVTGDSDENGVCRIDFDWNQV
ncbi:ABC transporter ATP-binding protein [Marinicella litoralis]|nr:ATP-binding cassette domain-containing protein [Marinicella litoralis]